MATQGMSYRGPRYTGASRRPRVLWWMLRGSTAAVQPNSRVLAAGTLLQPADGRGSIVMHSSRWCDTDSCSSIGAMLAASRIGRHPLVMVGLLVSGCEQLPPANPGAHIGDPFVVCEARVPGISWLPDGSAAYAVTEVDRSPAFFHHRCDPRRLDAAHGYQGRWNRRRAERCVRGIHSPERHPRQEAAVDVPGIAWGGTSTSTGRRSRHSASPMTRRRRSCATTSEVS